MESLKGDFTQDIHEVAPGVYAGQAKVGNEIVYFGMEKIDADNKGPWIKYARMARNISEGNLIRWLKDSYLNLRRQKVGFMYNADIEFSGFTNEEYNRYLDKIDEVVKNSNIVIVDGEKLPSVINALKGLHMGVRGFSTRTDGNNYVIYASKKPVKGKYPFPNLPKDLTLPMTLKQHYHSFGDILMSVGSEYIAGSASYENRGIFKNPISFIEDGSKYPGLSMKLHGFSGAVIQYISKDARYMEVRPVPAMARIIINTKGWNQGDILINNKDVLEYTPEDLEKSVSGAIGYPIEPHFKIKIEALISLFKDSK